MTRKQSVLLMNLLARLIGYVNEFALPHRLLHGLVGYDIIAEHVRREMAGLFKASGNIDEFLQSLQERINDIISNDSQESMLLAYHLCLWLDRMLTYEDVSEGKLSIYELIPLRAYSYVSVGALNDNYKETGIWINPKLPIFRTSMILDDGTEREKAAASRDAFVGINGDFRNISYFKWNRKYVVHNIIVPYEYREDTDENSAGGKIRVGFIPISDKTDLIVPDCVNCREGKYELKKMYINAPNHEAIVNDKIKFIQSYKETLTACSA